MNPGLKTYENYAGTVRVEAVQIDAENALDLAKWLCEQDTWARFDRGTEQLDTVDEAIDTAGPSGWLPELTIQTSRGPVRGTYSWWLLQSEGEWTVMTDALFSRTYNPVRTTPAVAKRPTIVKPPALTEDEMRRMIKDRIWAEKGEEPTDETIDTILFVLRTSDQFFPKAD